MSHIHSSYFDCILLSHVVLLTILLLRASRNPRILLYDIKKCQNLSLMGDDTCLCHVLAFAKILISFYLRNLFVALSHSGILCLLEGLSHFLTFPCYSCTGFKLVIVTLGKRIFTGFTMQGFVIASSSQLHGMTFGNCI